MYVYIYVYIYVYTGVVLSVSFAKLAKVKDLVKYFYS